MGQRVYLPKDIELDIGAVHLTPATTNISLRAIQVYPPFRAHGETYRQLAVGSFGRGFGIAGIYDGPEADAFEALRDGDYRAARMVADKGHINRVHAGMVLPSDYSLTAATEDLVVVSGAAEVSGVVYIGSGDALLADDLTASVAHDAVSFVVRTAGIETAGQTGTVTFTATAGGNTYVVAVEVRSFVGCYLALLPERGTGNAARPVAGNWTISATATRYTTDPVIRWSAVRPEGKFN